MIVSWIGLILGVCGVVVGQILEGGHLSQLTVPTAALIVFGGTLGATILSSTPHELKGAIKGGIKVFFGGKKDHHALIKQLIQIAGVARREGILALERVVKDIKDPFFSNNLRHIVDGYDPKIMAEMMENHIIHVEETGAGVAKVYETAGGFAPTIGIIGAVLGLIHVMSNLSDSSKLGAGIAVAFVATVYGVGSANLIFLPMANKLKKIAKAETESYKIIYTGLIGIQNGLNPRIIEDQLHSLHGEFGGHEAAGGSAQKKAA